ncbi:dephospho-CoA kinase [Aquitalea sp. S1-19]|nr:dephospho-CoA kinase [Aquitalea sp. S1-19]
MAACKRAIIGLTGGIGSGKSAVAQRFAALGVDVVDTDEVAHALSASGGAAMPAIAAGFGPGVIAADGSMDRAAMRALVFADPARRAQLEGILHPLIHAESLRQLSLGHSPYAMLVVPLLFETGTYLGLLSRTLAIDCPEEMQVSRVMQRSRLTEEQVHAIMAAQLSRSERKARSDDVIDNSGDLTALDLQVALKHRYYLASFTGAACPPSSTDHTDSRSD